METSILILAIILLIPIIYFLYFWANSEILTTEETEELALSQRYWDIYNYLGFTELNFEINKDFKSALNKNGQLYNCDESLSDFPSIASALLKGKKHEWIVFAFAKDKKVYSFYANKGNDNQSVSPNLSSNNILQLAISSKADMVLEFHNHPNAVLSSSQQDINSADYFGKLFSGNEINFLSFVCGRGRFYQYGWWFANSFYYLSNYFDKINKENGKRRKCNFELRKELKRKKYFKDFRLNKNSSHNFIVEGYSDNFQDSPLCDSIKENNR